MYGVVVGITAEGRKPLMVNGEISPTAEIALDQVFVRWIPWPKAGDTGRVASKDGTLITAEGGLSRGPMVDETRC